MAGEEIRQIKNDKKFSGYVYAKNTVSTINSIFWDARWGEGPGAGKRLLAGSRLLAGLGPGGVGWCPSEEGPGLGTTLRSKIGKREGVRPGL